MINGYKNTLLQVTFQIASVFSGDRVVKSIYLTPLSNELKKPAIAKSN